jgi:hypothetical protein
VDRRVFVAGTLGLLAAPLAVEGQQAGKVYRIGILSGASAPLPVDHPAFLRALRERGYVPGQNLLLEERYAGGTERLPTMAAELAGLDLDIVVTIGTPAARAAKAATRTIPVVFTIQADPVGRGLVTSLAHPGVTTRGSSCSVAMRTRRAPSRRRSHVRRSTTSPTSLVPTRRWYRPSSNPGIRLNESADLARRRRAGRVRPLPAGPVAARSRQCASTPRICGRTDGDRPRRYRSRTGAAAPRSICRCRRATAGGSWSRFGTQLRLRIRCSGPVRLGHGKLQRPARPAP